MKNEVDFVIAAQPAVKRIHVTDAGLFLGDGWLIILAEMINSTSVLARRTRGLSLSRVVPALPGTRRRMPRGWVSGQKQQGRTLPAGQPVDPRLAFQLGWHVNYSNNS